MPPNFRLYHNSTICHHLSKEATLNPIEMDTKASEVVIVDNECATNFHRRKRRKLSNSSSPHVKESKVSIVRRFLEIVPLLVDDIRESLECDDLNQELSRFGLWSATVRHPRPYMVATSIGFFEGLGHAELTPTLFVDPELHHDMAGGRMLGLLLKGRAAECPVLGQQLSCALVGAAS